MTLRVLAFTPQPPSAASSRYRVYQWREPLRALGIELDVAPFFDPAATARLYVPGDVLRKAWDLARLTRSFAARLREAARYDVVLVHRQLWPVAGTWPLASLRRVQPRWAFDFDDAVFLPNASRANRRFVALKSHGDAAALAAGAVSVSAGNSWLAEWARRQRPSRPASEVEVVPTVVDSERWTPTPSGRDQPVRLVWIGSPSTLPYLAAWGPALSRLGARHAGLELHVIGAGLEVPGLRCRSHAWSAASEREIAGRCHIALAPLGTGEWERGKCGLKLLLGMALGLPVVASHAGVHGEIVTSGEDGILVGDDDALAAALDRLVVDAPLRARMGRAARATLERRYSLQAVGPRLAAFLCRAAEAP